MTANTTAGSSASDLAAAREIATEHVECLERGTQDFAGDPGVRDLLARRAWAIRLLLSWDGDDSARLDWLERQARKDESIMLGFSRAGSDYDEWHDKSYEWPASFWCGAEDANDDQQPFDSLRKAIDAARTAPGGASNA